VRDAALRDLARAAGVHADWRDAAGELKTVAREGLRAILTALELPCDSDADIAESRRRLEEDATQSTLVTTTPGEWAPTRLAPGTTAQLWDGGGRRREAAVREDDGVLFVQGPDTPGYYAVDGTELTLACAPRRSWTVADAAPGRRLWGAAAQLYALRGRRETPFGDFGSLADFARALGRRGADALAISPVHALFAADPSRFGPYAPSNRLFLNVLFADLPEGDAALGRGDALIDWPGAGRAKLAQLRAAYDRWRGSGADRSGLEDFRMAGAKDLERHARFEALSARFFEETGSPGWYGWPAAYLDPEGEAVTAFAREHETEVDFHRWLQWRAAQGLDAAQREAKAAGMAIGLISDLAVGVDSSGSQVWSRREDFLNGLSIGAPPDIFQPAGQDWGLTSFSPRAFRRRAHRGFAEGIARALRSAGGVRIDHAMGLQRLWLTPHGASPKDGAYVDYPLKDMLRLIALESYLHKAIVVGEDLGTVPEGFRETTTAMGMYGMRVLWFEREADEGFIPPERWSAEAMAMTSTHDLPTVAGWWKARDVDWLEKLNRKSRHADPAAERAHREEDRERLWRACESAGVGQGLQPPPSGAQDAADVAVAYVARSGCELAVLPLEDLLGHEEQPNHPGTTDEAPNWRRRLDADPDTELDAPRVAARIARLNAERPRATKTPERPA
jgi:4-alpha-glucanotransferase